MVAQAATAPDPSLIQGLGHMLWYLLLLVLVFIVGSYALKRGSRRFLARVNRKSADPTPDDDVWAMHKLPPDAMERLEGGTPSGTDGDDDD